MTAQLLPIVYRGTRTSFFVFHPVKQHNQNTRFDDVKDNFLKQLHTWYEVVELYQDDQTLSEVVVSTAFKKELNRLLVEVNDSKNPYLYESLAEALWDKPPHDEYDVDGRGRKCEQHCLPTMRELEERAKEIRADDLGVVLETPITNPIRRTWSG